jgi:hypothetical protein
MVVSDDLLYELEAVLLRDKFRHKLSPSPTSWSSCCGSGNEHSSWS